MSCSSDIEPLQLTFQNITLTDDGRAQSNGIAVQIGTPPQTFSLTPSTLLNNTFVNNLASCGSEPNSSCISVIGGGYDASGSSSSVSTTYDAWNGSAESTDDAFVQVQALYFNDVLSVASQKLFGFPLLIQATSGANFYAGLGLGKNSTFISRLLEDNVVPSRSWSLYPGMYSATGAGSLIIGGYADRFHTGQLHHRNLSDAEVDPSWQLTRMEYQSGSTTVDLLPNGTSGTFTATVEPYYPSLTVPDETLWKWGNATNGTWSPGSLLHKYSPENLPTGNITITLANGLRTTIPNKALFSPPAYDNGVLSVLGDDTNNTVYSALQPFSVFTGGAYASPDNLAILGIPYAAMVYIIMDWEKQRLSIANANQAAQISGDAIAICGSSSSKKEGGSNTGAIAGGVVGGIAGLALIAVLAWFLWRRKKRNGAAKVENASTTNDVAGMNKAELPQYSAVDHISPTETKSAADAPVQEMPADHATAEMPGTQQAPPKELSAEDSNVIRSELPG